MTVNHISVALALAAAISAGCEGGTTGATPSGVGPAASINGPSGEASPSRAAPTVEPNTTPAAGPIPLTISPADDGRIFSMLVGQTTNLIVRDPTAIEPRLDGDSIELIAIVNVAPSGQREWEVHAIAVGRTSMTGGGAMPYVITIDVIEP